MILSKLQKASLTTQKSDEISSTSHTHHKKIMLQTKASKPSTDFGRQSHDRFVSLVQHLSRFATQHFQKRSIKNQGIPDVRRLAHKIKLVVLLRLYLLRIASQVYD